MKATIDVSERVPAISTCAGVATRVLHLLLFGALLLLWPGLAVAQCTDHDADGYFYEAGCGTARDCNDYNTAIHPGATEICNGFDDDCDSSLDEGCLNSGIKHYKVGDDAVVGAAGLSNIGNPRSIAWTGTEHGFAWSDARDGNQEIYFGRADASGNKIGVDVRVTTDPAASEFPFLVWTGSEYGVAWRDQRDGHPEIYFALLDSAGGKLGSDVRITNIAGNTSEPWLVWTGGEYAIAWSDPRSGSLEIYFARISASGSKIGADVLVSTGSSPSLVWTGTEYGVAWQDTRTGGNDVYFARLDAAGAKIGADIPVPATTAGIPMHPCLVWTGSGYGVSWEASPWEVYFARLDPSGNKIGVDIQVTSVGDGYTKFPSMTWTGGEYGIVWIDSRGGLSAQDEYFKSVDPSGNVTRELRLIGYSTFVAAPNSSRRLVWTGAQCGAISRKDSQGVIFSRLRPCDPSIDADSDGASECVECDDNNSTIHPGAPDPCDGVDQDCDGADGVGVDADHDGYATMCDCNDGDYSVNPGRSEVRYNGKDDDCNPATLDDDFDGDGYFVVWANTPKVSDLTSGDVPVTNGGVSGSHTDTHVSDNVYETITEQVSGSGQKKVSQLEHRWTIPVSAGQVHVFNLEAFHTANSEGDDFDFAYSTDGTNFTNMLTVTKTADDNTAQTFTLPSSLPATVTIRVVDKDHTQGRYVADSISIDHLWIDTGAPADCNDNDPQIHPGAAERCNLVDDDCDGTADESAGPPGPTTGLVFPRPWKTELDWTESLGGWSWDVVKGDLALLKSSAGDFTSSLLACLENDSWDTTAFDTAPDPAPGGGFYYLVRTFGCSQNGTYDEGAPGQQGARDGEIGASPQACP